MKAIVAGSRDFNDYDLLKERLNKYFPAALDEIVWGGAQGADSLGERYANEKNIPIKLFPADWKQHGKAAGPIRNKQMAEYADACIVFWDGKSRGTQNMIHCAKARGLLLYIVEYKFIGSPL